MQEIIIHFFKLIAICLISLCAVACVYIMYSAYIQIKSTLRVRRLKRLERLRKCEHVFKFHNHEIMEHEPFCVNCKRTLTEINN